MKKTAIVILNWNGAEMLLRYLPSVLQHSSEDADIYVADNASTDNSLEVLHEKFPECHIIQLDRNWGYAEGYNKALSEVEADYYLLLNSDIEVTPGWLKPLLKFMDANSDVAACQPKLLSITNRNSFEYAGAGGGLIDRYGYPFCRGRIFDTVEHDNGQYNTPKEILWATGAALMVRSSDYKSVGGLDGRFFAHNEEIDMCWRLRLRGHKIYCIPESYVYHLGGGTLPKSNPMKTYLNFRNNLTMLYKCLPDSELKHVMRVRWFLDYLAAFEMLILKHSLKDFMAVFRARRAFRHWKKQFKPDRDVIQRSKTVDDVTGRYSFSLLWQYYINGKKHYSDYNL